MRPKYLNPNLEKINLKTLLEDEQVIVIDDFYQNLVWLDTHDFSSAKEKVDAEQVHYINKQTRLDLLNEISKLFPGLYYPSDAGWIRSNIISKNNKPKAAQLHSDSPYIVVSICLSNPPTEDMSCDFGTIFYRHKDLGFKKINGHKMSDHYLKIFMAHKEHDDNWEPWFKFGFKKNRAVIYDGSLIHRMPWPVYGDSVENSRLLQVVNFRMNNGFSGIK